MLLDRVSFYGMRQKQSCAESFAEHKAQPTLLEASPQVYTMLISICLHMYAVHVLHYARFCNTDYCNVGVGCKSFFETFISTLTWRLVGAR
jgi:hypothetical protein